MTQKVMSLILLLTFINLQFSCSITTEQKYYPNEARNVSEKISSVVLRNGERIEFERGGNINRKSSGIRGVTPIGDSIFVPFSEIQELRTGIPKIVQPENSSLSKISEVITSDNSLIRFDTNSYESARMSWQVKGNTVSGKIVYLQKEDIKQFRTGYVESISLNDFMKNKTISITELILNDDKIVIFCKNSAGYYEMQKDNISGWTKDLKHVNIDFDRVLYVNIEKSDIGLSVLATVGAIAGVAAGIFLIILALKESCPFIYSYDGEKYVFDAEPLGGATTKSQARTDYSKLEFLKPVKDKYQILIKNEVDETQYIDQISLIAFDHSPNSHLIKDSSNNFYQINYSNPSVFSIDENQQDISKFFSDDDGIAWQTHLSSKADEGKRLYRHTLTFKFIKPKYCEEAKFIIHAGTSLWGSNMIREMYELWGSKVDGYIAELNQKGKRLDNLNNFMEREELYKLKVYILKNDTWVHRGNIIGGGPFIYESQLLPIRINDIPNDTISLQIRPPVGYWSIDYIGVNFESSNILKPKEIQINTAYDEKNNDVKDILLNIDGKYYVMPTKQNVCRVDFKVPEIEKEKQRTIFLNCNGYYDIHLLKKGPPDLITLQNLIVNSGSVIDFTYKKFIEWRSSKSLNAY